ncbi:fasciclin-like arabinogalactan protein 11 [Malania oleifera]|uniref:fasciclin-like arabinogalactan protein 11 n=1 Tax=Malania oleifera TaxID=397392 RepID=UPI0025AE6BB8|nr:fasciclin-like arabinogalactan protein 11 [Malania oleifera]
MTMQLLSPFPFLLLLLHFTTTLAQPSAQSPALPGPVNLTSILDKAGQYTTFIKFLKSTQVGDQIKNQLNNSNQGLTVFAPADNAFSSLKPGILNSLDDQQKVQLLQFHILPSALSIFQLQTASNPLRTQAGSGDNGQFPLNVTSSVNQVNITTGVVSATLGNTLYTDNKLAVYQVDQVLLPMALFGSQSPAPAPSKPKGKASSSSSVAPSGSSSDASVDTSAAVGVFQSKVLMGVSMGVGIAVVVCSIFSMAP